jgi:hypothetical protein
MKTQTEHYIDTLNKIYALLNKSRELIYVRDMENAYRKLDMAGLGCYKLSNELRRDLRLKI